MALHDFGIIAKLCMSDTSECRHRRPLNASLKFHASFNPRYLQIAMDFFVRAKCKTPVLEEATKQFTHIVRRFSPFNFRTSKVLDFINPAVHLVSRFHDSEIRELRCQCNSSDYSSEKCTEKMDERRWKYHLYDSALRIVELLDSGISAQTCWTMYNMVGFELFQVNVIIYWSCLCLRLMTKGSQGLSPLALSQSLVYSPKGKIKLPARVSLSLIICYPPEICIVRSATTRLSYPLHPSRRLSPEVDFPVHHLTTTSLRPDLL